VLLEPLPLANQLRAARSDWTSSPAAVGKMDFLGNLTQQSGGDYS